MSSSIVTIQLGNYANFIGSHYWNLHEYAFKSVSDDTIDPDVQFSEGHTTNNVTTYTPRLISMDWKENLGANIIDDIYEEIENEGDQNSESRRDINSLKVHSFSGKVAVHTGFSEKELNVNKQKIILPQTDYMYWNEYLYSRFHPRTLTALPKLYRGFNRDNFTSFSQGLTLASSPEFRENMEEQTRYFVEKCDFLQGFQLLCDSDSGFSGVASTWLEHLCDEYRQPTLSMPVSRGHADSSQSLFNIISLFSTLNEMSVATLPLSVMGPDRNYRNFGNVSYDPGSNYHTSAIIATAVKSLMLPCTLKHKLYSLCDFSSVVGGRKSTLASLALSIPLPMGEKQSLCSTLASSAPSELFTILNQYSREPTNVYSVIGTVHGVPALRAMSHDQRCHPSYKHCTSAANMIEMYANEHWRPYQTRFFSLPDPLLLSAPFPSIFSPRVDRITGEIMSQSPSKKDSLICPQSVPLSTMLFSDDSSEQLMPVYLAAKDALRRNKLADVLSVTERDSLTDVLENFRNII